MEENENARPTLGHPALLLIVAGVVGILADALLFGQASGSAGRCFCSLC